MKCIIVDDDPITTVVLKHYIEKIENLKLAAEFKSPIGVSDYLKENDVDFVLLDVEMPGMTGIEAIINIDLPQTILISSNKTYAAEGFNYNVTDFLTKPIDYERFCQGIKKVHKIEETIKSNEQENDTFFIKDGITNIKLTASDVFYIEALGDYVKFHTNQKKFTVLATMKSIELKLAPYNFARIHRSYIVNLNQVKEIKNNSLKIGNKTLSITRSYKPSFLKRIKTL